VQLRELRSSTERLSDRRCAEQHDKSRLDEINLAIEPVFSAGTQLITAWGTIPRRSALHAVGHKDFGTREPDTAQHLIEEAAGSADKWTSCDVFFSPWGLTDEHHPGGQCPLARHGARPAFAEPALHAPSNASMKGIECRPPASSSGCHRVLRLQFHGHLPCRAPILSRPIERNAISGVRLSRAVAVIRRVVSPSSLFRNMPHCAALRLPPRSRWRVEILGRPEGTVDEPEGQTAGNAHGGPSPRVRRLRGRDSGGRVRSRPD
jgi:hypothetical protein